jgi:hypothetical protein
MQHLLYAVAYMFGPGHNRKHAKYTMNINKTQPLLGLHTTHSVAKSWNVQATLAGKVDFRVNGGGEPSTPSIPQWT